LRAAFVAFLLAAASLSSAAAETQPYRAGIARLLVQGNEPFSVLVWYPSPAEETEWQQGPFPIQATRDAPIAPGPNFPIVLFSHGGGASGGSPLIHREIARYLARAGFIVVAPFHAADQPRLRLRPPQIRLAFEAVRADPRFGRRADAERVGMIGFSLGGAVALITAGAVPNLALLGLLPRTRLRSPGVRGRSHEPAGRRRSRAEAGGAAHVESDRAAGAARSLV
jgi:predicted dienelactone hydrolase